LIAGACFERKNMMPNWVDEQIARQHFEDLTREEHLRRLAIAASAIRPQRHRFYGPLLAGLGHRLVVWGGKLETRYSAMIEPTIVRCNGEPISGH
jgi:hypothetical protein